MNKLFNFTQTKGKWHKFPSFNSGREAKLYKNFAQKLLAVSLCMAMVLLGVPATTFAVKDVPVAASVYIKATGVPNLVEGEALPSLEGVDLEVTVFAPGVSSPSASVDDVVLLENGNVVTEGSVEAGAFYSLEAVFVYDGSFTVDSHTTVASNLGVSSTDVVPDGFVVALPLVDSVPVVTVDVVGVRDLVVGQSFPELGRDNFAVSATPAADFAVPSASVTNAVWCTTSDWQDVDSDAGVQPGVSYGIVAIVAGDDALLGGPSAGAGVASSSPVGLVIAPDPYAFGVGLVVGAVSVPVTGVSLSDTAKTLAVSESFNLTATVSPEDATNKAVKWTSSDETVASVDENGTVKALKAGSTTITVTTEDGAKTDTCEVTVKESSLAGFFSAPPAALSDLTFNGASQTLISAGTLNAAFSGCHVEYAVVETCPAEDSTFWSTSLPMGTGAGTYKVWYRVVDSTSKAVLGVSEEPILVTIAPRSLTEAAVGFAGGPHYYTGSEVTPPVSVSLTGFGLLTDGTDYVVSYSNNTNAGTATVTITGRGDFTGTVSETFTITKATPDSSGLTTSLDAFYGQTLSELHGRLAKPKDLKGNTLEGSWSWADKDGKPLSDDTKVGSVGEHTFTALFTPEDTNNYAWTSLAGWDADKGALVVVVTVKVSFDTSKWGDAQERPGDKKTQYVDKAGKTSIEVKVDNLSAGRILWLFEESYGTSAWYGLDLSADAFALDKGLRFYVQWVSPDDAEYNTYYSQLDDAQKARVEGDNGWIFLIGVEDPEGNKVQPAQPVSVYVQLGKDWDPEHLNAYYISTGADVGVPIKNLILYFPGGSGIFGCMTLSHFSPYFIFDELTDEEKAALNSGNVKTGDIATQITVAGLGMTLVLALGIMLRLITSKRKFEE